MEREVQKVDIFKILRVKKFFDIKLDFDISKY